MSERSVRRFWALLAILGAVYFAVASCDPHTGTFWELAYNIVIFGLGMFAQQELHND